MNVLLFTDAIFIDHRGGSSRVPWESALYLAKAGHRVSILTRAYGSNAPFEDHHGIFIYRYEASPRQPLRSLGRGWLRARSIRGDFDAIHIHHPYTGLIADLCPRFRRLPRIYFFHSPWAEEYKIRCRFHQLGSIIGSAIRSNVEHTVLRRAGRVVVLSQFMSNLLQAHHRIPAGRIARIAGSPDPAVFRRSLSVTEARRRLGYGESPVILFTIRNLEPRMGLENLIGAMPFILSRHPDTRLAIGGTGTLERFLRNNIDALNIGKSVSLLGAIPTDQALALHYQAADAFILPTSQLEGFGLVTVEALSCGCPVIATQVGATPEILKPLDTRFIVTGTSPQDISRAVLDFIDRRPEWPSLRKRCEEYAASRFGDNRFHREVESLTASLLETSSARGGN